MSNQTCLRYMILFAAVGVASGSFATEPVSHERPAKSPLSPEGALQQFVVHPDLQVELVAAEPEVIDPVAMAFDEHGRLWVVEMRDYPFGPQAGQRPQSRIKRLEDRDGDGRYETAHTFAEGLLFATGVQPWRGGVIVTLSGEVAWLADTDGDHRADVHQTWLTGFAEKNPQLRANDPSLWFDGNVYVAGGLFYGGKIATVHEPWQDVNGTEPIELGQRDFRFDPRTGRAAAVAGGGQFGIALDAFGNRFVCSNSRPVEHVVVEEHHLARRPGARLTKTNERVVPGGDARTLYPLSRQQTTSYLHEGQFTAACGLVLYGGDALPDEFRGNAFICEPTASLVHREALAPRGPTFASRPAREGVEFLASRDGWFRPVFLSDGPDGALYVVDMYRAVIEHPEWFADLASRGDLTAGSDRGRIWRITRRGGRTRTSGSQAPPRDHVESLIASLEHANQWHRLTAARLLYERTDTVDAQLLRNMAMRGRTPEARSAALHILDGLGALTADDILAALGDRDTNVRRAALRLAEPHVAHMRPLFERVREIALDSRTDRGEHFAAILSLGAAPAQSLRAVFQLAAQTAPDDEWMRAAILALPVQPGPADLDELCRAYAVTSARPSEGQRDLIEQVAEQIGRAGADDQITEVISSESSAGEELARLRLVGLARGTGRRGISFREWITKQEEPLQQKWQRHLIDAARAAADDGADVSTRRQAIELLEHGELQQVSDTLQSLASDADEPAIRTAAIHALAGFNRPEAAEKLLQNIHERTPGQRRTVLESLLGGRANTHVLLEQIEQGTIASELIDAGTRQRLLSHPQRELRERAEALFEEAATDRAAIIAAYRAAVATPGDAAMGKAVFTRHCATCHRVGGVGTAVGPDVADNYNKTREQLLVAILDPNRNIESRFEAYLVVTRSGLTLQGLLASETTSAVTIQEAEGKTTTIARDEIAEMRPTGVSLMPAGVEKDIDVRAMADLLAFLKGWRELRP